MIIKYYGKNGELAIYEDAKNVQVVGSDHESEYQSTISVSPFNESNLTVSEKTILFHRQHDGRRIALHVAHKAYICNDKGETIEQLRGQPTAIAV